MIYDDNEDQLPQDDESLTGLKLAPRIAAPLVMPMPRQPEEPSITGASLQPPEMPQSVTAGPLGGIAPLALPQRQPELPQRPEASAYEPHGWRRALGALSVGAAAYGNPQMGQQVYHNVFEAPGEEAQKQYDVQLAQGEQQRAERRQEAAQASTTGLQGATAEHTQAETEKLKNPPSTRDSLAIQYNDAVMDSFAHGQDPRLSPKVQQLQDLITSLQPEKGTKSPTGTDEDQRYEKIKSAVALKKPVTPEDTAWASAYEKRKTLGPFASAVATAPARADTRSDKSYQYNSGVINKTRAPIDATIQRLSRLNDTLAQNSPQADALVAPELMVVMAGGMGTGIRINEAEINRTVGGRSKWQALQAAINQWKLDPKAALSITPEQRQQIRDLVKVVNDKVAAKQKILDDAEEGINNTDDVGEHRRIVGEMKKKLSAVDSGEGAAGGGATTKFTDAGKTYNIPTDQVNEFKKDHPNAR
jgi:hypothetical protein